ncbi:MAG: aminotransferase class V-fold PLP-dependent enzyme [Francisellaceae bacterium]
MKTAAISTPESIYLLNHSVGLAPENTAIALAKQFFSPWSTADESIWSNWLGGIEKFKAELAQLLNGKPCDFCPQTNLSSGLTKILYSLPFSATKKTILLSEQDFPSMAFVCQMTKRFGFDTRFIPKDEDLNDETTWAHFLDDTIGVVLITHVLSNTSQVLPVQKITSLCQQHKVYSIVDIAQSVGILPIDIDDFNADFILGSSVKWLCGGPGAAFLWVNPKLIDQCQPVDVGWFSHENPFEFDPHRFQYATDASRFWGGTPSIAPFIIAANSIEYINTIGIEAIRRHNLRLTQPIIDRLSDHNLMSPRPEDQRGGTVVIDMKENQPYFIEALNVKNIKFDQRETGIRLSPHIYNSESEVAILLSCIDRLCRSR